ncbi:MAG: hypothetical protein NZ951_01355 [Dehalococcoidia bacterium]|nr:hypothetical protein [Dehalococcoidia bacterium]MDW8119479.1 hypothetical protein [Chloroflexota bacterium]
MPLRLAGEVLEVHGVDSGGWLREVRSWDSAPGLVVDQRGSGRILELRKNGAPVWFVDNTGGLLVGADNAYDIGSTSLRPRNLYWGTQALAPPGSASAPAYTFAGSAGTGLFSPAGNTLALSTGGTERWRISSAGHLLAGADNAYDIGTSGAHRPRDVFITGRFRTTYVGSTTDPAIGIVWGSSAAGLEFTPGAGIMYLVADNKRMMMFWGSGPHIWVLNPGPATSHTPIVNSFQLMFSSNYWDGTQSVMVRTAIFSRPFSPTDHRTVFEDTATHWVFTIRNMHSLTSDGQTVLHVMRRAGGSNALVEVRWKNRADLADTDKVLILAS